MDIRLIDDIEFRKKWFQMDIGEQMANIGGEVNRAIRWSAKGNEEKSRSFCNKAKILLQLSIDDPKNRNRRGELCNCIFELEDRFLGENYYQTSDSVLQKYYDSFIRY